MRTHMMLAVLSFPIWPICLALNKVYLARAVERRTEEIRRIINASLMGVGFIVAAAFVTQFHALSRLWVLSMLAFVPICLVVERTLARRIFARLRREGRILRRVLVVGTDPEAIGLVHATQRHPELGYQVVGFVGPDDIGTRGGCTVLGGYEDTQSVLEESGANGRDDLAGVGRAGAREPAHPPAHRRRLPRCVVVRAPRHRHRALPRPGRRRAHPDLRRADDARRMAGDRQAGVRRLTVDRRARARRAHPGRRGDRDQARVHGRSHLRPGAGRT